MSEKQKMTVMDFKKFKEINHRGIRHKSLFSKIMLLKGIISVP